MASTYVVTSRNKTIFNPRRMRSEVYSSRLLVFALVLEHGIFSSHIINAWRACARGYSSHFVCVCYQFAAFISHLYIK